jgi:hypothetical protein
VRRPSAVSLASAGALSLRYANTSAHTHGATQLRSRIAGFVSGSVRSVQGDDAAHAGLSTRTCIVVIERAAGRDAVPGDECHLQRWYGTVIVRKGAPSTGRSAEVLSLPHGFAAVSTVFIETVAASDQEGRYRDERAR